MIENDDLTSRIPLRENLRNIKNIISCTYNIDKSTYYLPALKILLSAVQSSLSLVLSAEILERLYEGRAMEEVMRPAAVLLVLTFLMNMAGSVLQKEFIGPGRGNVRRVYDGNLAAKYQYMDYSLIDSPYVKHLRERISADNNWGNGMSEVFADFDAFMRGICSLVCSVVVAFPVLKVIVLSRSLWMYLGFLGLAVVLSLLTAVEAKAQAAYWEVLLADPFKDRPDAVRKAYQNFTWSWVNKSVRGNYHYIKDIHLYDGFDLMEKYTAENLRQMEKVLSWASSRASLSGRWGMYGAIIYGLTELAGYLVSAGYALMGAFPVGSVIKFAGSITSMINSIQSLAACYAEMSLAARKQASTLEMMRIGDEMYKGKLPVEKRLDNKYEVEFRNVSFKYPGTDTYALKDFSLKLRIGERMAIVGMNGSGKTTMIKLLCRLYDPQEGEILLNGVDIRKFAQDEYIRLFSVVFQDFKLLAMPLGQNVASSLEVDEGAAMEALRQTGMAGRVKEMPEGLDTYLYQNIRDDGVEISGGEAQKIAIARALYKDAPFVLLDEPTASLDPLSEYEIYAGFDTMVKDKTAIYISHRLSSCRFCNDIVVLHEGRMVQRGSHEELLGDVEGKYYELWNAQAQYYH